MVAVKAVVILAATMAHACKSLAAMCALTTVAMAKAVQPLAAHAPKAVALPVARKAVRLDRSVAVTMAMNCHATLTP
jgi:hypothetical protein